MKTDRRGVLPIAFALYCVIMLWLLYGQRLQPDLWADYRTGIWENLNFVPLDTVKRYLWVLQNTEDPGLLCHAAVNLAGNVVMFIPLGALLPGVFGYMRRIWRFWVITPALLIGIELTQLVTLLGSCDVDDLILNLFGVLLGWLIWLTWQNIRKKKD